ncbi:MAG: HNH endonuclease [Myxococcota bacterium]|nr:HNH endonuclease [Myxococcota bacterium]MDW8364000.1 HNH endonuclease [Myxococcales bacterium]
MSYGLRAPVLVLNRFYQPVRVTSARQAFEMLYMGRARVVAEDFVQLDFAAWLRTAPREGDECIGTVRGPVRVPRVLVLVAYDRVPRVTVRLSRRNVFLRDGHTCQYCGARPPVRELNLDHVVPRSRGGRSTWDNLVTSCRACNLRKGGSMPHECGMQPLRPPIRPRWSAAVQLEAAPRRFAEWEPFLVAPREVAAAE